MKEVPVPLPLIYLCKFLVSKFVRLSACIWQPCFTRRMITNTSNMIPRMPRTSSHLSYRSGNIYTHTLIRISYNLERKLFFRQMYIKNTEMPMLRLFSHSSKILVIKGLPIILSLKLCPTFFHLKGIVSRDFGGLQIISVNRIGVPDVPLEVYSF